MLFLILLYSAYEESLLGVDDFVIEAEDEIMALKQLLKIDTNHVYREKWGDDIGKIAGIILALALEDCHASLRSTLAKLKTALKRMYNDEISYAQFKIDNEEDIIKILQSINETERFRIKRVFL
jgi:hypothetical protein